MDTSSLALLISLLSVLIAGCSLGWTIRRDIMRPKLKVGFGINLLFSEKGPDDKKYLIISGTNFGPNSIKLTGIILRTKWVRLKKFFRLKVDYGYLIRDYKHPATHDMPCFVQVGDRKNFFLVYNRDCFLKESRFVSIGLSDSFGEIHWVSRKKYRQAQKEFKKETWEWLNDDVRGN